MKQSLINLLPPATIAAIWAFWAFAPSAWVDGPWAIMAVGLGTLAFVQLLELVFERHEGWRINGKELATDVFYVAFGYGVIGFLTETLVNGPLSELKQAWGIATPWLAASPFMVQVLVVMFVFEFGQYWMHRAMHNWTPLWLTHAPHHHITQLNAMKGFIGNPIELFLISLGVISLLDVDLNALFAAITAGGDCDLCPCQCPRRSADLVQLFLHHHPPPLAAPHRAELRRYALQLWQLGDCLGPCVRHLQGG